MNRKKSDKISKGYRLKPGTHELIFNIQGLLNSDQDTAIAKACSKYYKELVKKVKMKNSASCVSELIEQTAGI